MTDQTPDYLALAEHVEKHEKEVLCPELHAAAAALRIADKTIREPLNAFCRDTFRIARNGECPVHGGDACLLSPFGLKQENADLRSRLAAAEAKVIHYMDQSDALSDRLDAATALNDRLREALRGLVEACVFRDSRGAYLGCRLCGTSYPRSDDHDPSCSTGPARSLLSEKGEAGEGRPFRCGDCGQVATWHGSWSDRSGYTCDAHRENLRDDVRGDHSYDQTGILWESSSGQHEYESMEQLGVTGPASTEPSSSTAAPTDGAMNFCLCGHERDEHFPAFGCAGVVQADPEVFCACPYFSGRLLDHAAQQGGE